MGAQEWCVWFGGGGKILEESCFLCTSTNHEKENSVVFSEMIDKVIDRWENDFYRNGL